MRAFAFSVLCGLMGIACADTAKHLASSKELQGQAVGQVAIDGHSFHLFKDSSGKLHRLPVAEWEIAREKHAEQNERPQAESAFQWPKDLTYKDKPRSQEWCENAYSYFRDKLAILDGQAVDLITARRYRNHFELGWCCEAVGKVAQVIDKQSILFSYTTGVGGIPWVAGGTVTSSHVICIQGIDTSKLHDDALWEGILATTGTYAYTSVGGPRRTVLSARPLPDDLPAVTRPQFVQMLRCGFELARWGRRPRRRTDGPGRDRYIYHRTPVK